MKTYVYTRVSKEEQSTEQQEVTLRAKYPDAIVVSETESGAKERPELKKLVSILEADDILAVVALDRLGRTTLEILTLLDTLQKRKVNVISIREGIDFTTPVGKLVSQIMIGVAELERNLIIERTKAALKLRKDRGMKLGRPKEKHTRADFDRAKEMWDLGLTWRDMAYFTKLSRETLKTMLQPYLDSLTPEQKVRKIRKIKFWEIQ